MRRALVLAVALALAAPPPRRRSRRARPWSAAARSPTRRCSSRARYRDTILPGERLFYGVRLEPGQQLRMRAKLDVKPGEIDQDTAVGFAIGLQTPLREVIVDYDDDIAGNNTVGVGRRRARGALPARARGLGRPRRVGRLPGPGRLVPVAVPDLQRAPAGEGRVPGRARARGDRRPAARRLARADAREGDPDARARGRGRRGTSAARSPGSAWPACSSGWSAAGWPRAAPDVANVNGAG